MYNTVPDLEASEAQPLVAAPPRKHGKAMLAVVAALAFGAGALAPSAAARVSQMKLFGIVDPSNQNAAAASTGCDEAGDNVMGANCHDKAVATTQTGKIDIGGTPSEGVTTETGTEQFQIACGVDGKPACPHTTQSAPGQGKGAEDTTVVSNDKTNQPDSGVTAANYIAP